MNTPRPSRRWFTRPPAIALGVVVLLALAAWIAVAAWFPPARVRALLAAQLSRSLAREVTFDDVGLRILPPVRLQAKGVRIAEPGGLSGGAAVEIEALSLDLDAWALLRQRFVLRQVVLDRPALHVVLHADGRTNLDGLAATDAKRRSAPMDFDVRTLRVRQGRVLLDDLRAKRRTAFQLDTELGFSSRGGQRLATSGHTTLSDLALGPLAARRIADLDPSLAKLEWVIDHDGRFDGATGRLALTRLSLGLGEATLALSGTIDHPGPRATVDLRARGQRVDLAALLEALSAADAKALHGIRGRGRLAFDLGIRGTLAPGRRPDVTGTLEVEDGAFGYPGAPPVDGVRFTAHFAPDRVEIADLRGRVSDQPLRAQITASRFADPHVRFALQGNLDLATIAPLVAPKDVKLAGRADVNVRGEGRAKDPGAIALDGRAQLTAVSVEAPTLPKRIDGIGAAIQFSPARAAVRGLTARAGKSSFRMSADVARPLALLAARGTVAPARLDFTFVSPYLDVAELLPPGPGDPLHFNATGGGKVTIGRLLNDKLDVRNVTMDVTLAPSVIEIPAFALDAYGGRVHGHSRLDFTAPYGLGFALAGRADHVRAEDLLDAWTPVRKGVLTGTFDGDFDLSGDGTQPDQLKRTLSALGVAQFLQGQIGGPVLEQIAEVTRTPSFRELRFKDTRVPFRVEHGRVVSDSLRLATSVGDWRVAGATGFDGVVDYAVSVTLAPEVASRIGIQPALAAGALSDPQGRVVLDLRVTGPAKAPRVILDTRSMRDRIAGRAGSLLTEQRRKIEQDLLQKTGLGGVDSMAKALPKLSGKDVVKDVEKQGRDLLEGFFGRKKPAAPPAPPPDTGRPVITAPAARDTAARDTAH